MRGEGRALVRISCFAPYALLSVLAPFGPSLNLSRPKCAVKSSPFREFAFESSSFGPCFERGFMVKGLTSQSYLLVPSRSFGRGQSEVVWIQRVLLGFFKLVEFSENGAPADHGELIATAGRFSKSPKASLSRRRILRASPRMRWMVARLVPFAVNARIAACSASFSQRSCSRIPAALAKEGPSLVH